MLNFQTSTFFYEPFPIGTISNVFDEAFYRELVATYPSHEICKYMPKLGHKYSLSEVNFPDVYQNHIEQNAAWKKFHSHIKSKDFIHSVLDFLKSKNINLGLDMSSAPKSRLRRLKEKFFKHEDLGLSTRFEFSLLPVNGGHILPHTDSPGKIITLVFAMIDDSWTYQGGGTETYRPKDTTKNFNQINRYMGFDDMELLRTLDFQKNSCGVFIKTFNSWHGVSPMTDTQSKAMRKTLTINIERTGNYDY